MGASSDVFLRMTEEHYLSIPEDIRMCFLSSKRVDSERGDWSENMTDEYYSKLYNSIKSDKKSLEEREFQLRENRRNNK